MVPIIISRSSRMLPLVGLLFMATSIYLLNMPVSPGANLPKASVVDYTSPATHCFWPAADNSDAGAAVAQPKVSSDKGTVDTVKEWMGWAYGEEGDEDAAETENIPHMEQIPEGHGFEWQGQLPDVVPVSGIERYTLAFLEDLQDSYNQTHDQETFALQLGDISLAGYSAELYQTYKDYLVPTGAPLPEPPAAFLPALLSRLSLRPPITPLPPRPKHVMTTEKTVRDLPWQFNRWKEIMPDWEIKYFDDKALKNWVHGMFGDSKSEEIWQNLPRQVLKTDVFRYMAILVEGGIYTDSDTAPIIHADDWGYPHHHHTPALLTHLYRLLSLSTSPHLPSSHPLSSFSPDHAGDNDEEPDVDLPSGRSTIYDGPLVDDGAELGQPSLVVSVESDAIAFGWDDWRAKGMSRAIQITQWTFMARPGHPVFLDALGRALRKSEEMSERKKEAEAKGENFIPESALEWTGPGVFSDCVYRYLLARYGFQPSDLVGRKEPIRVGDVLILPAGSFSSLSPFEDEEQRPWAATWHGFLGRWRESDPGEQESERLKKIKADADAAEKLRKKLEAEAARRKAKLDRDRAKALEKEMRLKAQAEKVALQEQDAANKSQSDDGGRKGGPATEQQAKETEKLSEIAGNNASGHEEEPSSIQVEPVELPSMM